MKGLTKRIATAVIFVLIMMGGLFGGRYPFTILFAVINGLCLWEFLGLTLNQPQKKRDLVRKILGVVLGMAPFLFLAAIHLGWVARPDRLLALSLLLVFPIIFLAFIYELYTRSEKPFSNLGLIILSVIYIGVPFALVNVLAFQENQFQSTIIFSLLLLTWANDTGAYFVGSKLGKTPLFPRISPKKTWEGSLGGLLVSLALAAVLFKVYNQMSLADWLGLSVIISVFGSFGDLVESMLKRSLGKKDSGSLLPGHGGILDRFDGFIFMMPFVTSYLLLIR
ncbi:MAG: phosphatidate cytidylyltransferase [Saprospiraceae bacterium]|nr:phosphatidate cytidylyltransferase [Saprospiraceae bacterium]